MKLKFKNSKQGNLLICLVGGFMGVILFMFGFHNIDICQNLMRVNEICNNQFVETNLLGNESEASSCYMDGIKMLLIGFLVSCFSIYGIGHYVERDVKE